MENTNIKTLVKQFCKTKIHKDQKASDREETAKMVSLKCDRSEVEVCLELYSPHSRYQSLKVKCFFSLYRIFVLNLDTSLKDRSIPQILLTHQTKGYFQTGS